MIRLVCLLLSVMVSQLSIASPKVHVVEFVNFGCSYSNDFNQQNYQDLKDDLKKRGSELVIAPFSNTKTEKRTLTNVYWALDIINQQSAEIARDYFFKVKKSGFPLNSRSSVESMINDFITLKTLGLEGLNYDRLFALAESENVRSRQRKALSLISEFNPKNLPFFVIITDEGPVELVERSKQYSGLQLANHIRNRVDYWYGKQEGFK